jgi:hypothetical protein
VQVLGFVELTDDAPAHKFSDESGRPRVVERSAEAHKRLLRSFVPTVRRLQELGPKGTGVRHIDAAAVQDKTVHDRPGSADGSIFNVPALCLDLRQLLSLAAKLVKEVEFRP